MRWKNSGTSSDNNNPFPIFLHICAIIFAFLIRLFVVSYIMPKWFSFFFFNKKKKVSPSPSPQNLHFNSQKRKEIVMHSIFFKKKIFSPYLLYLVIYYPVYLFICYQLLCRIVCPCTSITTTATQLAYILTRL